MDKVVVLVETAPGVTVRAVREVAARTGAGPHTPREPS